MKYDTRIFLYYLLLVASLLVVGAGGFNVYTLWNLSPLFAALIVFEMIMLATGKSWEHLTIPL
jgi:hypothetical protein